MSEPIKAMRAIVEDLKQMNAPTFCRWCAWVFDAGPIGKCPECDSRYLRAATPQEVEDCRHEG